MPLFQKVGQSKIDRKDHVWRRHKGSHYKCVLCGAITHSPPQYPTPGTWMPTSFEKVTMEDRSLCERDA